MNYTIKTNDLPGFMKETNRVLDNIEKRLTALEKAVSVTKGTSNKVVNNKLAIVTENNGRTYIQTTTANGVSRVELTKEG